ncbi:MAG: T9SS type A sorting domain-containing protein [Ignavibacteria bacterium]|nr:T9SS type A sorting domain-containing protein [Ignavibacteria bacterium]
MKPLSLNITIILLFIISLQANSQLVKGPKNGSVASGVIVNTGLFSEAPFISDGSSFQKTNNPEVPLLPPPPNMMPPSAPEGSNYLEEKFSLGNSRPVVEKNFRGINDQGGFPPDPIMAAGPNHIMVLVNSAFRIYDKNGTTLKTIQASVWFNSIAPGSGPNDPQVIYDNFANRWVMQWMTTPTASEHYHLFSVSDDSNPMGQWINWRTPSFTVGDSGIGSWGDYPALGYDAQAIYLTSRQFAFSGSFRYSKLRIINKAELYSSTPGAISWKDFWDFRDPSSTSVTPDNVRPMSAFDSLGMGFMMNSSPFSSGTYLTLWKIHNPITTPTISGANVSVTQYSTPPNANQLGGSSTLIEGGGSKIRANVIYRDSSLWAVHCIGSGAGSQFSAVRYVRINPFTSQVKEDIAMGKDGFWHFYPAIMVDEERNIIITYSRSGLTEYIGAYVTGRKENDSPGLSPSVPVKVGEANYVKVGNGRNRWGDYNGIALDPIEQNAIWTFTEFAPIPANTWGTWVGKIKMSPFPGRVMALSSDSIDFGSYQIGETSDTLTVLVTNDGIEDLIISNVSTPGSQFHLVNLPSLPITVSYFDTAKLQFSYTASVNGVIVDSVLLTSNNSSDTTSVIALKGKGYTITPAQKGVLYVTTGSTDGGRLLTINPLTGVATPIGSTGFSDIVSVRVHPQTHELVGLAKTVSAYNIVRINSTQGDAYSIATLDLQNVKGMEFKSDGTLFVGSSSGSIYSVDMNTGDALEVALTGIQIAGLAINPITNQMWASVRPALVGRDKIYKINFPLGDTVFVGNTGLASITPDLIFDATGRLYGLVGTGISASKFISIDTSNAVGTVIGNLGISNAQALALWPDSVSLGIRYTTFEKPTIYSLEQNYPNPFNPVTEINFQLPKHGFVTLKIFDVLGRDIETLVQQEMNAGKYFVQWNAHNVPSGMYFYKLTATGEGESFSQVRKMALMK